MNPLHTHTLSLQDPFHYYPYLRLLIPYDLFLSLRLYHQNPGVHFSSAPSAQHAPPISSSWLPPDLNTTKHCHIKSRSSSLCNFLHPAVISCLQGPQNSILEHSSRIIPVQDRAPGFTTTQYSWRKTKQPILADSKHSPNVTYPLGREGESYPRTNTSRTHLRRKREEKTRILPVSSISPWIKLSVNAYLNYATFQDFWTNFDRLTGPLSKQFTYNLLSILVQWRYTF